MGRHRRSKLALGARSTVVKAAAAMGVATALAAGINSAANGPVNSQAAADTTEDPVAVAGVGTSDGQHTGGSTAHTSVPTGVATESASAPKLIQPAAGVHRKAASGGVVRTARQASDTAPNPGTTPAPTASTAPATSHTPAAQHPAPAQGHSTSGSGGSTSTGTSATGTSTGQSSSTGTQSSHPVGTLLGGVVGSVGGAVDDLLG